jgi:hypothetical protein
MGAVELYLSTAVFKNANHSLVPVAHACNASYSGGRDQGGFWFEASPRQIVPETLCPKNPSQGRVDGVAQGVGPEFKPPHPKKKKRKPHIVLCSKKKGSHLPQGKRKVLEAPRQGSVKPAPIASLILHPSHPLSWLTSFCHLAGPQMLQPLGLCTC